MDPRRDPRSVVTPDAFSVSQDLVGLPLARPRTRLAAILVDLVVVAIVSQLGWTLLGLLAAFYFFRMATRRSAGNVLTRAAQYSMGCAGAFVLGLTIIVATGFLQDLLSGPPVATPANVQAPGLDDVLGAVGGVVALRTADTEDEAMAAADELVRVFLEAENATPAELESSLEQLVPEDPGYDRGDFIERVMAMAFPQEDPGAASPVADSAVLALPLPDALERYAALARRSAGDEITDEELDRGRALRERIRDELTGDSIAELNALIATLADDVDEAEEDLAAAQQAAAQAQERRGFFAWAFDTADELGLAFGWGALYFSAILAWTNGLTPGKRLFRLRVVRLSGEPMSWLMAFERSGGYAAGFATGLLGFAHMLWDPNRMGIHDKIAETVVIKDGAPKVEGHWNTTGDTGTPSPAQG